MCFFLFNHWPEFKFELIQSTARDCSDIGKTVINDRSECQEAASKLQLPFGYSIWDSGDPKGCFYHKRSNLTLWNTHEYGGSDVNNFLICLKGGNYNN